MTAQIRTMNYIGRGEVTLAPYGGGGPNRPIGQVSNLSIEISEDKKELPDNINPGGGIANSVSRITGVSASITMHNLSPDNLAIALRGTAGTSAAVSVSNEEQRGWGGGALVETVHLIDVSQPVTVTRVAGDTASSWSSATAYSVGDVVVPSTANGHFYIVDEGGAGSSGGSEPTWPTSGGSVGDGSVTWRDAGMIDVASAALQVVAGGIKFADEAGLPVDGAGELLSISYTSAAADWVESLTGGAGEYLMVFNGLNEASSNKPFKVRLRRLKFSPTSGLDLIGDDFAGLELTADLLPDDAVTDPGLSKYLKAQALV